MPRIEKSKFTMDVVKRSNRFRVVLNIPVKLGLKDGTLVDVSISLALLLSLTADRRYSSTTPPRLPFSGPRPVSHGRLALPDDRRRTRVVRPIRRLLHISPGRGGCGR